MAQDHVLATTLFVTDMDKKPAMNDAWAEWFAPNAVPARATIQIETLGERRLFEVTLPQTRLVTGCGLSVFERCNAPRTPKKPLVIWLRTTTESSD